MGVLGIERRQDDFGHGAKKSKESRGEFADSHYCSTRAELTGELREKTGEFPLIAVATQSGRTTIPEDVTR